MIKINYCKSEAGYDNCFFLSFYLRDYIPEEFFHICENELKADLYFYLALFESNGMYHKNKKSCHEEIWSVSYDCVFEEIWSVSYDCVFEEIPFTMWYDEDYDMITFSLDVKNIKYIVQVAEKIKSLVLEKGMKQKVK